MGVFSVVLIVVFAIICLLLILMVTIQDEQGDGLGGVFAGAGSAAFGSRSSSVIVRFTYVLGALFFVIALSLAIVNRSRTLDIEKITPKDGQSSGWMSEEKPAEQPSPESTPKP